MQSIRYTKNLGNTAIYVRLRNLPGQFWNFTTSSWAGTESNDTKLFLTEHGDSDPVESLYSADVAIPTGGPYTIEAVLASTGEVIGSDTTAMDAPVSSRLASASYTAPDNAGIGNILTETQSHPTLAEIEASMVLAKEATVNTRLAAADYTAPDNAGIGTILTETQSHPTLAEIEASTVLAKEATSAAIRSDLARVLGLVFENHVEDDIVRTDGLKTGSTIYCYDSAAHAELHDKIYETGLIAKYNVSAGYDSVNGWMTMFKVLKA